MTDTTQPRNNLMTREDLNRLAGIHDARCISIYIPTSRAGEDVNQKHDQVKLKNTVQDIRMELEAAGLTERERNRLLSGAMDLLEDEQFWRHQSDGLAVFIHGNGTDYFTLPVAFEQQYHIAGHFHIIPLIPYFNENGTFYLLAFSQQHVKLYACSRDFITELEPDEDAPGRLEDVVGEDYEQKSLQFRTGHGSDSGSMYHGQGSGKDDRDKEIEQFIRAVDEEVLKVLGHSESPLVLACDDQYFPVYRDVTKYPSVTERFVRGTPDEADPYLLHEEAWLIVKETFAVPRKEKKEQIRDLSATGKTAFGVDDIVPAALDGRIDTLFIAKGEDLYGIYDQEQRMVVREDPERAEQVSLFNMAAVNTLLNSGEVYVDNAAEMPFKDSAINALFRY